MTDSTSHGADGGGTTVTDDVVLYQPRALRPGEIVGHYRIEAPLGQGGNGAAYAARNIDDEDERVAIKLIRPDRRDRVRLAKLLRAEAGALRRVKHEAIVQYRTFKRIPDSDEYYLVTEHIEGPTLSACIAERSLTVPEVRRLAIRVARALSVAHNQGVIHRDLSPDNIILPGGDPGRATLIDFGIAKHGTVDPLGMDFVGKLAFAAPEQFEGDPTRIGPWTDLYSLGLVLVAAARGKRLDMGRDIETAMMKRRTLPELDEVSAEIRHAIAALLTPDPAARTRSAAAAASLFGEPGIADSTTFSPLPLTRIPTGGGWARLPAWLRVGTIGAAAVLLVFGALVAVELVRSWNTPPAPTPMVATSAPLPSSGTAAAPPPPVRPTTLDPTIARAAEKSRAAAAAAHVSEARGQLAAIVTDAIVAKANTVAADAALAAEHGREFADLACRGGGEGYDCINLPDGRHQAGQRTCYNDACIWTGYVVFTWPSGEKFEGQVENNRLRLGAHWSEDGMHYEGAFDGSEPEGLGRVASRDGTAMIGQFRNGRLTGFGKIVFVPDGSKRIDYRGGVLNNNRTGPGVDRWQDDTMSGDHLNDQFSGYGVETAANFRAEAEFQDWFMIQGVRRYSDGRRYEGSFGAVERDGERVTIRSGPGVLFAADGTIEAQGLWQDDRLAEPAN